MFVNYSSSTRRCFLMATWNSMFLSTSQGKEIHGVVGSVVVQRYGNLGFCLLIYHGLHHHVSPFSENMFATFSTCLPSKSKLAIWALDKSTDLLRGYCWDESGWMDFCFHDGNWKRFEKYGYMMIHAYNIHIYIYVLWDRVCSFHCFFLTVDKK